MSRYFLQIAYKGTAYHGWQVQPNAPSIQALLNEKISLQTGGDVYCVGCGRTDTGVHASQYMLHFDTERALGAGFIQKLNSFLPRDVAAQRLYRPTVPDAHARFSALKRSYRYHITLVRNPFLLSYAAHIHHPLDVGAMQAAAQLLPQYQDYEAMSKVNAQNKHHLCKVFSAGWQQQGHELFFDITANRFLRGMVRVVVGSLLLVGRGKMSVEGFRHLIESRNRRLAGAAAPAEGLYLTEIEYPQGLFEEII